MLDWHLVAMLVLVLWLEGSTRIADGAIVLQGTSRGRWRLLVGPGRRDGSWIATRWLPTTPLVVLRAPAGTGEERYSRNRLRRTLAQRHRSIRRTARAMEVVGASSAAVLVGGVPAATANWGRWGFIMAALILLLLLLCQTTLAIRGLRKLGLPWRRAVRYSSVALSPFSAPSARELLYQEAVAGLPRIPVVRYLLGPSGFTDWVRPSAYDALHRATPADSSTLAGELLEVMKRYELRAILYTPPSSAESADVYCVRCGALYNAPILRCAECAARFSSAPPPALRHVHA